jgi:uncharacterized membrane protein YkvA (DUF1232 family)
VLLEVLLVALLVVLALYAAAVATLAVAGRHMDAASLARFAPDCVVLVRRLAVDSRVPMHSRLALVAVLVYLVSPFDLIPDFIPVAGQIDDAVVLLLVLRHLLRAAGPLVVQERWPGPARSLRVVLRLAQLSAR